MYAKPNTNSVKMSPHHEPARVPFGSASLPPPKKQLCGPSVTVLYEYELATPDQWIPAWGGGSGCVGDERVSGGDGG